MAFSTSGCPASCVSLCQRHQAASRTWRRLSWLPESRHSRISWASCLMSRGGLAVSTASGRFAASSASLLLWGNLMLEPQCPLTRLVQTSCRLVDICLIHRSLKPVEMILHLFREFHHVLEPLGRVRIEDEAKIDATMTLILVRIDAWDGAGICITRR